MPLATQRLRKGTRQGAGLFPTLPAEEAEGQVPALDGRGHLLGHLAAIAAKQVALGLTVAVACRAGAGGPVRQSPRARPKDLASVRRPIPAPPHLSADSGDGCRTEPRGAAAGTCHPRQEKAKGGSCAPQVARPKPTRSPPTWGARLPGAAGVPGRPRPLRRGRGRPRSIAGRKPARALWTRAGEDAENRQGQRFSRPADPWSERNKADCHSSCLAWPSSTAALGCGGTPRLLPRVPRQPAPWKARNSEGALVTTV